MERPTTRAALEQQLTSRDALLDTLRELREDIEGVVSEAGERRAVQPGSFADLSLKDVIAHLTDWRVVSAIRLEAGLSGEEPVYPWPAQLDEHDDQTAVNRWFYEAARDKPLATVMAGSRDTFERCARAIAALPEDDLFKQGRFPWLGEYVLGPAVVSGAWFHYYEDHEPEIREWLARG